MDKVFTVLSDEDLGVLRKQSELVVFTVSDDGSLCLDVESLNIIDQLKRYVLEQNGLGMSAVQLGVAKRIFVMRHPYTGNNIVTVINPKIVEHSENTKVGIEGCFSVPLPNRTFALVSRHIQITVEYNDQSGKQVRDTLHGMSARVFQHELDHLDGKLMIDKDRLKGWSEV
jgi:peptide deformylase